MGAVAIFYLQRTGFSIVKLTTFLACIAGLLAIDRLLIPALEGNQIPEGPAVPRAEAEERVAALLSGLAPDCVVLHRVAACHGNIEHVVLRQDGAVFLIETKPQSGRVSDEQGELRLNGTLPENDLIGQTRENAFWLRGFLKARLEVEPAVHAAIIFPNAYVSVRNTLRGVDVINPSYFQRWMAKAPGNPEVARKLGAGMEKVKSALLAQR